MPPEVPPATASPLTRKRTWTRRFMWTAIVLAVLAGALYLFRVPLFGPLIRREVAAALDGALGGRHEIEAVSGTFLSDLTLTGLRTVEPGTTTTVQSLRAREVRVEYDVLRLIREGLPGVRNAVVDGLDLTLQPAPEPLDAPATPETPLHETLDAIPPLPPFSVDGVVQFAGPEAVVRLAGVSLRGGGGDVDVTLTDVVLPIDVELPPISEIVLAIRRNGRVVTVTADRPAAGVLLERATLDASPDASALLVADVALAEGRAHVEVAGDTAAVNLERIELARLPAWLRDLLPPDVHASAGRLDATATAPLDGFLPVTADVQLTELLLPGLPALTLTAAAAYDGEGGRIERADVAGAGATLSLTGVDIDPDHPWFATAIASYELSVPDVAATAHSFDLDFSDVPGGGVDTSLWARGSLAYPILTVEASEIVGPHGLVMPSGTATLPRLPEHADTLTLALRTPGKVELPWLRKHVLSPDTPELLGRLSFVGGLTGQLSEPKASGEIAGRALSVAGRDVDEIVVDVDYDGSMVNVKSAELRGPLGELVLQGTFGAGRIDAAQVSFETTDVGPWLVLVGGPEGWSGALSVAGTAGGDPRALTEPGQDLPLAAELTVRGRGLTAPDGPVGDVDAVLVADGARLELRDLRIAGRDANLTASASWDRLTGELRLSPFDLDVRDLVVVARVAPDVRLAGTLTAKGSAQAVLGETLSDLAITADVDARSLRVDDTAVGDVVATLRTDGETTELASFTTQGAWGHAKGAGSVRLREDGGTARLTALDGEILVDGTGVPLTLRSPAALQWTGSDLDVQDLDLDAFGGRARGALTVGERIAATLAIEDFDLSALPLDLSGATGRLTATLDVAGPRATPRVTATIDVPDLALEGLAGHLAARLEQPEGGVLDVRELDVTIGATTRLTGSGRLPFRLSEDGVAAVPGARPSYEFEATAEDPDAWLARAGLSAFSARRVVATLDGDAQGLRGAVAVTDLRAASDERFAEDFAGDTRIDFTSDASGVDVRASAPATAPFRVTGSGSVRAATDWSDPLGALRAMRGAPISGDLVVDVPDIALLAPLAPAVARAEGAVRAELRVSGTTSAPVWQGAVSSDRLAIKPEGDTPTLTDCVLRATFDATGVRIERLEGELGYAPISVTGTLPLAGGGANADLRITGENALLVRNPYLRLRADVDLAVTGPFEALRIAGSVNVTRGLYSRPIDLVRSSPTVDDRLQLFSLRIAPLDSARLDVRLRAKDTLRVDNNLARGTLDVDLRIRGTGAVPEPEGNVAVRDLLVTLPFSRLRVEQGLVTFRPGQPFDPVVSASATSRMRGYDLRVQLDGPLDATNVHVTATPPLSPESARLLLATGSTAEELERDGIQSTALSKAGSLLGGALLSWVSGPSDPDAESFADRVTVEMGREVSETGAATIDAELRLAERWYLHGERDRYDDLNLGLVWRVRFK